MWRDWVYELIVLRKFNREVKERNKIREIEKIQLQKELDIYLTVENKEIIQLKCNYCNIYLKTEDVVNNLCGFCYAEV